VPVIYTETQSNPGSSCHNTIVRTWTATDSCGNTASCSQTITVNDTTPPSITCPPDVVISNDGACLAVILDDLTIGTPTVSDNCGGPVAVVPTRSGKDVFNDPYPVGTTTITWTATDSCGNQATCS
jgi:hypothetical protein